MTLAALLAGCVGPTSLSVHVDQAEGITLASFTLSISRGMSELASKDFPETKDGRVVGDVKILVADEAADLSVVLAAVDSRGRSFSLSQLVHVAPHRETGVRFVVGDALAAACRDNKQSADETDLDCGGAACPPCGLNARCTKDTDCETRTCSIAQVCVLASGPPVWKALPDTNLSVGQYDNVGIDDAKGRVYSIGGQTGAGDVALVERFDFQSATWVAGDALPIKLSGAAATRGGDGRIVVFGADPTYQPAGYASADPSVPNSGSWMTVAAPTPRKHLAVVAGADGSFYAIGGRTSGAAMRLVEVFHGTSWSVLPDLINPRAELAGAIGADGLVYVFGGYASDYLDTIDVFDPQGLTWMRKSAKLSEPRAAFAAVNAPDGRIFLVCGAANGPAIEGVDAYTVGIDRIDRVAPLNTGREACGASIAPDGRVMVFGGAGGNDPDVELYGPTVSFDPSNGVASGAQLKIIGENFAANAKVRMYVDDGHSAIAEGQTNATGVLSAVTFLVPMLTPGTHTLRVVDDRSRYPIRPAFIVSR